MIGLWTKTPQSAVEAKKRRDDDPFLPCMKLPSDHRWTEMLRHFPKKKEQHTDYTRLKEFEYAETLAKVEIDRRTH